MVTPLVLDVTRTARVRPVTDVAPDVVRTARVRTEVVVDVEGDVAVVIALVLGATATGCVVGRPTTVPTVTVPRVVVTGDVTTVFVAADFVVALVFTFAIGGFAAATGEGVNADDTVGVSRPLF